MRLATSVVIKDDGVSHPVSDLRFVPGQSPMQGSMSLNYDSEENKRMARDPDQ